MCRIVPWWLVHKTASSRRDYMLSILKVFQALGSIIIFSYVSSASETLVPDFFCCLPNSQAPKVSGRFATNWGSSKACPYPSAELCNIKLFQMSSEVRLTCLTSHNRKMSTESWLVKWSLCTKLCRVDFPYFFDNVTIFQVFRCCANLCTMQTTKCQKFLCFEWDQ